MCLERGNLIVFKDCITNDLLSQLGILAMNQCLLMKFCPGETEVASSSTDHGTEVEEGAGAAEEEGAGGCSGKRSRGL